MSNILIIGATSAIASETARIFAGKEAKLYLIGRDMERMEKMAEDLKVRGANAVGISKADLTDLDRHEEILSEAVQFLDEIDIVLIAHGILPDQMRCEQSFSDVRYSLDVNLISIISLLTILSKAFERQGRGTIVVLGSVAGDRGRQSNYVYGAAKAALSVFLDGLRNRLYPAGIHVLTVKPGFVDTPMTASFRKGLLWSTPDIVARGIVQAIERRKNIVYLPWFWRYIMMSIRAIPESVFKRLRL